ncbi:MAG: hypothetical protein GC185_01290 [Alphaproteobacteria bacterium]|nr:hypothetical protein [Alphaproteobacteria bacterium]
MSVKDYQGAVELPVPEEKQAEVAKGVADLRATMKKYGFAAEAVESLDIEVKSYTLTISREEGASGAFHTYADGKPFYAVSLKAPGSLLDLQHAAAPVLLPPGQQALTLALETGINLFPKVEYAIETLYGDKQDPRAGGVSGGVMTCDFETCTRREPEKFFAALTALTEMRLNMLVPENLRPAAPEPAPKKQPQKRSQKRSPGPGR